MFRYDVALQLPDSIAFSTLKNSVFTVEIT
jgi:hypothetical protein